MFLLFYINYSMINKIYILKKQIENNYEKNKIL